MDDEAGPPCGELEIGLWSGKFYQSFAFVSVSKRIGDCTVVIAGNHLNVKQLIGVIDNSVPDPNAL